MDDAALIKLAGVELTALTDGVATRALAMMAERPAGPGMLKTVLAHELVAGHALMMRLAAKTELFLGLIAADRPADEQDRGCRQAVRLSTAAARLTERYRQGLVSLAKLEGWADPAAERRAAADELAAALAGADVDFDDADLDVDGGNADDLDPDEPDGGGPRGGRKSPARLLAELAAFNKSARAALDGVKSNGNGNGTHLHGSANRGRLRHGNPSGDFAAAPRCGARTRAGHACGQPAMPNGRCRMHGGLSTGARSEAGRARCRTVGLVHGERTAEIIELKNAAARHGRRLHALAAEARRLAHAEAKSERATPCQATPAAGKFAGGPMGENLFLASARRHTLLESTILGAAPAIPAATKVGRRLAG